MSALYSDELTFKVPTRHRWSAAVLSFLLPLIRLLWAVFPFLKRKVHRHATDRLEHYAVQAYLADKGDVGFFETFILKKGAVDRIIQNFEKRHSTWKKDSLIDKLTGMQKPREPENFESINVRFSLEEKKQAVVDIIREEGRVIPFFGKRLAQRAPHFYEHLCRVHQESAPPAVDQGSS